jgi:Nitroreductase family
MGFLRLAATLRDPGVPARVTQGWQRRTQVMADATATDGQALLKARFGMELPGVEVPDAIAPLLDRRVVRRYTEQPVPDQLLDALLAAAQSAPAKSDLQQYSVVVMRDAPRIKQIADWIGTMDWIATAPVFLVWCGDMRRGQRLCEMHKMPHANNNLDTFLNTAVDCSLAMAQFMTAAEAVGLGTCPISYVRSHIQAFIRWLVCQLAGRCSAGRLRCACRRQSSFIGNAMTTARWNATPPPTTRGAANVSPRHLEA